jgi:hypothetical protein
MGSAGVPPAAAGVPPAAPSSKSKSHLNPTPPNETNPNTSDLRG